jgi:NAD(P)H dehydrogenase (quinone)
VNVSVILAHPHCESFNHAIAYTAVTELQQNGHCATLHDLYAEKFDPLLPSEEIPQEAALPSPIKAYCDEIASAAGIIVAHPNWWGQPPAILKGWVDRVFRPGLAYQFLEGDKGEGVPVGLLKARVALVFNTSNTPVEREKKVFGDPLEALWKICIFDLCGVRVFYREQFSVVITSTAEQRKAWLDRVKQVVGQYFPAER